MRLGSLLVKRKPMGVFPYLWSLGVLIGFFSGAWGQDTPAEKASALLERGQELFSEERYDVALQKFQFAIRNVPDDPTTQYWLGRTFDQLDRPEEAWQALQKAQALDPSLGFTDKEAFTQLLQKLQPPAPPEKPVVPPTPPPPPARFPFLPQLPPWPYGLIGGGAAGGLAILWLLRTVFLYARSKSSLQADHAVAQDSFLQVADALTRARQALHIRSNPTVSARVDAVELTFFEALDMLSSANQADTYDLPRVRRARELMEKAQVEIVALQDQFTAADTQAQARWGCFFCSKPLADPEEGDLLALRKAEETRHALICQGCSRRYRQKNIPPVRVVHQAGGEQHWATVPEYEPFYDFYHRERFGDTTQSLAELEELFFIPRGSAQVFVEGPGRPDYVLRVDELREPE